MVLQIHSATFSSCPRRLTQADYLRGAPFPSSSCGIGNQEILVGGQSEGGKGDSLLIPSLWHSLDRLRLCPKNHNFSQEFLCSLPPPRFCFPHLRGDFCCLVAAQSCLTLYNPMDCSMSGFPVLHHLLKLVQTHVH